MAETPGAAGYRQVSASDENLAVSLLAGDVIRRLSKSAMPGSKWEETLSPDELQIRDPRLALTPAELPLAAVERAWGLRKDDYSSGPTLSIDDAMHVQLWMPDPDGSSDPMGRQERPGEHRGDGEREAQDDPRPAHEAVERRADRHLALGVGDGRAGACAEVAHGVPDERVRGRGPRRGEEHHRERDELGDQEPRGGEAQGGAARRGPR